MLHAVIRTDNDAFHFFGEVSGYNVQTLQQHVRHTVREAGAVRLQFKIDPEDQEVFRASTARWLSQLASDGTVVEVAVRPH
jgi:hypothetical protein